MERNYYAREDSPQVGWWTGWQTRDEAERLARERGGQWLETGARCVPVYSLYYRTGERVGTITAKAN